MINKLALSETSEVVVNVQGDEPFIPPEIIRQVADNLANQRVARMATLSVPINDAEDMFNPNAVKVVTDSHGYALYFSRAAIPYNREQFKSLNDSSLNRLMVTCDTSAFMPIVRFLLNYITLGKSPLEHIESLEQLRVLWHGERIHVAEAIKPPRQVSIRQRT